ALHCRLSGCLVANWRARAASESRFDKGLIGASEGSLLEPERRQYGRRIGHRLYAHLWQGQLIVGRSRPHAPHDAARRHHGLNEDIPMPASERRELGARAGRRIRWLRVPGGQVELVERKGTADLPSATCLVDRDHRLRERLCRGSAALRRWCEWLEPQLGGGIE